MPQLRPDVRYLLFHNSPEAWHKLCETIQHAAYCKRIPLHSSFRHMALLEKQLVVRRSTLPHAGKGLFTKKFIPKGTRIVEYKGRIKTWNDISKNGHSSRYIFYVKRYHVIDAEPYIKAIARFANDAGGLTRVKGIGNNAYYERVSLRIFITAKKDIPAGSEILVDYGKEYWQAIRYNNKIGRTSAGKLKTN